MREKASGAMSPASDRRSAVALPWQGITARRRPVGGQVFQLLYDLHMSGPLGVQRVLAPEHADLLATIQYTVGLKSHRSADTLG